MMPTDTATTTARRDARGRFAPSPQARYIAIRARLDAPRRRVLTWDAQRELLHPHDTPDDADWPAPTNFGEARDLMGRLPHRVRVLCAYIAAEMVLPIWEQWADGREDVDVGAPRRALELVRRWLDGEPVSGRELRDAGRDASAALGRRFAGSATVYTAFAAAGTDDSAAAATAAVGCAGAADVVERHEFYARWWARCRSRLAIADITTAELEAV